MGNIDNIRRKVQEVKRRIDAERRGLATPEPPRVRKPSGGAGSGSQRAKTQEAAQTDGKISVKGVDINDVEVGDAFDVWMLPARSTVTIADLAPVPDNGEIIIISQMSDGQWHITNPVINSITNITVQTDTSVNGGSSLLQKKTRANVKVLGTDAESGVTTVHTGTVC